MDFEFSDPSSQGEGSGATLPLPLALQQLKLRWQAEKTCPEILGHQGELVAAVQRETEDMEGRAGEVGLDPARTLESQVLTMDLDRARFVLRSYLRCRLGKIDKHFLQIFADADLFDRLSKEEQDYCERSIRVTQKHLDQSVLTRLPAQYGNMIKQSDSSPQPDMIPEADLDAFVFCKSRQLLQDVQLDPQTEDTVTLHPNELHVLHYRPVRSLVLDSSLQLL